MARSEYLHFKDEEIPNYEHLIDCSNVIDPQTLILFLEKARNYLASQPGTNRQLRQHFAPLWFNPWIDYLKYLDELEENAQATAANKLKPNLTTIKKELDKTQQNGETSGLYLMAGGEGLISHQLALHHAGQRVNKLVVLLEPPEYMKNKDREELFLPRSVSLSMLAYYYATNFIGLVPKNSNHIPLNTFYQEVHNQTGAQYHFAVENDPNMKEKVSRGIKDPRCIIPCLDFFSTSIITKINLSSCPSESFYQKLAYYLIVGLQK